MTRIGDSDKDTGMEGVGGGGGGVLVFKKGGFFFKKGKRFF